MKRIFLLLFAILFLISCSKEPGKIQFVTVTGIITNPTAKDVKIYETNSYWDDPKTLDSVILDENNFFSMKIPLNEEGSYSIYCGEKYVSQAFLVPGDSLHLIVDSSNPEGMIKHFSGMGKSVKGNNLYQKFLIEFPRNDEYWNNCYDDDYKKFVKFINSRRQKQLEFYKKNFWNNDAPEIEKNYFIDLINYDWAFNRINYLLEKHYWDNESKLKIDSSDFIFLNEIKLDKPESKMSFQFNYFISRYLDLLISRANYKKEKDDKDELSYSKQRYDIAKKMFFGIAKNIALADAITNIIDWKPSPEGMKYAKKWLDEYKKIVTDSFYFYRVEKKYNERLNLMPGKPAPGFRMPTINGDTVALSDFKGKLVYIDFWGTWCSPCRKELPYYDTLQSKFRNNPNIVFLSLAMEYENYNVWKQFVKEKKLPGIHIYLEKQFNNILVKKYMISGVPTFVLIDKKGLIINANAPRPSADNIVEYINKYIN
ncbi:MAG: AhpC/TSA family protein [Bacteroidetes bacterium]|nr:MAG: AhpC/TSA family protein [Bacteroidota bacterium]